MGVVAQSLAEIAVLAEKGGVARRDRLAFINQSVMGSTFSRYKAPAYVNQELRAHVHPRSCCARTSTWASRLHGNSRSRSQVAALVHQLIQTLIGRGHGDNDFAALLELEAASAGLELVSENADISDGLDPDDTNNTNAVR